MSKLSGEKTRELAAWLNRLEREAMPPRESDVVRRRFVTKRRTK